MRLLSKYFESKMIMSEHVIPSQHMVPRKSVEGSLPLGQTYV